MIRDDHLNASVDFADLAELAARPDRPVRYNTLDFDRFRMTGLTRGIPDGYAGLTWDNLYVADRNYMDHAYFDTGFQRGNTSGTQVAYGYVRSAISAADGTFDLKSMKLTAAFALQLEVSYLGYNDGQLVHSGYRVATDKRPVKVVFDWADVDEVVFTAAVIGGDPRFPGTGPMFVIDDLVVSKVRPDAAAGAFGKVAEGALGGTDIAAHQDVMAFVTGRDGPQELPLA